MSPLTNEQLNFGSAEDGGPETGQFHYEGIVQYGENKNMNNPLKGIKVKISLDFVRSLN